MGLALSLLEKPQNCEPLKSAGSRQVLLAWVLKQVPTLAPISVVQQRKPVSWLSVQVERAAVRLAYALLASAVLQVPSQ